jgi:hypothetical protein
MSGSCWANVGALMSVMLSINAAITPISAAISRRFAIVHPLYSA